MFNSQKIGDYSQVHSSRVNNINNSKFQGKLKKKYISVEKSYKYSNKKIKAFLFSQISRRKNRSLSLGFSM